MVDAPSTDQMENWLRRPLGRALREAPQRPGVYAWWPKDAAAARLLGLSPGAAQTPLYVGMAKSDLGERLWAHSAVHPNGAETEFRERIHRWASVVLGLAPWYEDHLGIGPDDQPVTGTPLHGWAYQGAARFMERFLSVSWLLAPDAARARTWEARLIAASSPLFNVAGARVRARDAAWHEDHLSLQVIAQRIAVLYDLPATITLLRGDPSALEAARSGPIGIAGFDTPDRLTWEASPADDDERWEIEVDLTDREAIDQMACLDPFVQVPEARDLYGPGPAPETVATALSRFEREICHLWGTFRVMYREPPDAVPTSTADLAG